MDDWKHIACKEQVFSIKGIPSSVLLILPFPTALHLQDAIADQILMPFKSYTVSQIVRKTLKTTWTNVEVQPEVNTEQILNIASAPESKQTLPV